MQQQVVCESPPPAPVMTHTDGDCLELWWWNPWEEDEEIFPNYDDVWGFD